MNEETKVIEEVTTIEPMDLVEEVEEVTTSGKGKYVFAGILALGIGGIIALIIRKIKGGKKDGEDANAESEGGKAILKKIRKEKVTTTKTDVEVDDNTKSTK